MSKIKKTPEWKQFEIAITSFLKSLGGNAKITHDKSIPDKDTNTPRQRDIWIESNILGHFPIKVYVSCKFTGKKIDQQKMDAVIGELLSSGAGQGVIYSKTGFTPDAIKKGKKYNIFCCKLYQNKSPELPEILLIKQYHCSTGVGINCLKVPKKINNWDDLLGIKCNSDTITILDDITKCFEYLEKKSLEDNKLNRGLPKNLSLKYSPNNTYHDKIQLQLTILWRIYEADFSGFLINGSYNFTEKKFIGEQKGPIIKIKAGHPGENWKLLKERPQITNNYIITISSNPDFKKNLIKNLSAQLIKG